MYTIVPVKGKFNMADVDYEFKNFDEFYEMADYISKPLIGSYKIAIITDDSKGLKEFIQKSNRYASLNILLYVNEVVVDYLSLYNTNLNISSTRGSFDVWTELIERAGILFDKDCWKLLYNSIEHDVASMEEALNIIKLEYGLHEEITEEKLSKLFILNKTVYPRNVIVSYLRMDRYRQSKLDKCLLDMGNDIVMGSIVKNLKNMMEDKATYFKSGQATPFTRSINTSNLITMYRVFCVDRRGLNDVKLLLALYERGVTENDIIQN